MESTKSTLEGSEVFVDTLNACGVSYIFLSPGTGTTRIHEALSKFKALGQWAPEVVLSLHESLAMSAAHGYFMVSGKPQVVLVHHGLGVAQVGGALLNAQRGRAGVLLCTTSVPADLGSSAKERRVSDLSWFHEQFDQASIARDYVKWAYELRSDDSIRDVLRYALILAGSEPCGPVYISFPQDVLSRTVEEGQWPSAIKEPMVSAPQADQKSIDRAASILTRAAHPLIITGHSGRRREGVRALVELAETLGAKVVTSQYTMNIPTLHPLCGGFGPPPRGTVPGECVSNSDAILVVDADVPYLPSTNNLSPGAKVIHFDIDPIKKDLPSWAFPSDLLVHCDSSQAIPLLTAAIRERSSANDNARYKARYRVNSTISTRECEKSGITWR